MKSAAIIGVGQTGYRRSHPDKSSRELIWQAARLALEDAGVGIDGIDVILAGVAPDGLSGENSVERTGMLGRRKPFLRVNTGGVTGSSTVFAALSYINSGRAKAVLVVGLERMGQATSSQQVFNTIFDPIYEKDFPLTTITMAALRASMLMRLYGYTERHWAEIASRSFRNALRNPLAHLRKDISPEDVLASQLLAWPIHRFEACPMSEGACAMVIVAPEHVGDRRPAWVQGAASITDSYAMGDRIHRPGATLVDLLSLRLAAGKAYGQAGITRPRDELRVAELYSAFSSAEAMAYPALGFCAPEDGPAFVEAQFTDSRLPVFNPSGGPQGANPVSATAMVRIAECALQVRGLAGERQVADVERAVATGQGGATQFSTVCVLGRRPVH
ncbi:MULTISPECIES: thiolase family protein [unclassified Chelatococcus]|uniref:thiolase family protein n=1 Tax=unclassified Chelatococcus TaxID=2638111 RepID=UPI001BCFBB43|nr:MULTISPECIES: thiolase family protein [unclassified Chelatococcus]CAH1655236.1 Thiolase_N domain-containing protein [Hyphomicrobiales bacterium]MBS7742639.1 thiolase family protein [Chelatococcus sp. HY11]MBX3542243.1 thiolase family protein [Chelatococcus sp.]MCO5075541.1 thiolase family protein [Chelatococcus sp.]CAH1695384.1 Thiolase_N domain-containing protein [Hyphomicrobiales bacterium]